MTLDDLTYAISISMVSSISTLWIVDHFYGLGILK
jgi:hypothetical protein